MENGLQAGKMCMDIMLMEGEGKRKRKPLRIQRNLRLLSNWVDGVAIYRWEKWGGADWWGRQEYHLIMLILRCLFGHQVKVWGF